MALPGIGTLWVGDEVSWLEQLCLKSFLDNGHEVTVFSYDPVAGLPEGVATAPAGDIYPADEILRHGKTGSPAYHADIFRLHMLAQTGLIWVDTDAYCCRPWEIGPEEPLFGWISDPVKKVNNGVLRLPKDSATLSAMMEFVSDEYPIPPWVDPVEQEELQIWKDAGKGVHVSDLPWGVLGPDALTWFLTETGEIAHARPGHVLYPVPFRTAGMTLNPNRVNGTAALIRDDTMSIHFWGRRFRNVASKNGGVPPEGCYVAGLVALHGIDPKPTAHMMQRPDARKTDAAVKLPEDIDFTMFTTADVANVMLQRSELVDADEAVRAWMEGDGSALEELASAERDNVLRGALDVACARCAVMFDQTDARPPVRIADIGCGYALADLVLYHRYGCEIILIDIEQSEGRDFGFADEGAAYTDLAKARAFLEANGVPAEKIVTVNPKTQDLCEAGAIDLAISQISCGFHYPPETYQEFFREQVVPGGAIILDIRRGSGGVHFLKTLGPIRVLDRQDKFSTVMSTRHDRNA